MNIRLKEFRFKKIDQYLSVSGNLQVLDVGSGSHSASLTRSWRPDVTYTGIDINQDYDNNELDIKAMDYFIQMDLTEMKFDQLMDNHYDIIIMSHTIEHLHNGDMVLKKLLKKLKVDGIIYVEFPSERSIRFPSMKETLNFFDDPTHCRIFSLAEICNTLLSENVNVCEAGTRRSSLNILVMPLKIIYHLITKGYVRAGALWDYYGFADFVVGRK